jgi:hypothetical protein
MLVAVPSAPLNSLIDGWLSAYCATFFDQGLGYYSVAYDTCRPLMLSL